MMAIKEPKQSFNEPNINNYLTDQVNKEDDSEMLTKLAGGEGNTQLSCMGLLLCFCECSSYHHALVPALCRIHKQDAK